MSSMKYTSTASVLFSQCPVSGEMEVLCFRRQYKPGLGFAEWTMDWALDSIIDSTKIWLDFDWQGSKVTNYSNPICSHDTYLQKHCECRGKRVMMDFAVISG